ncbi:D-TA family PLP-dependent enzyme [Methylovirgula sp. 4M-Z18]|uniref:D-TA family PLP-dependent enzyme n=1 Tax=Methylovirgula sp. 4M-Z18 TaxID=2293567 RepID=UPI000E2E59FC|nr:D-TA family PLP-dependent enzyme [Methylovirgula sp. 4M-Z18]RFB80327.1 D-TA family PLP-dependent enzyme [Methylovirgula sp. 4M-Z18]
MTLQELETPCVLIDLAKVDANLRRAHDYARAHHLPLRPHIKTHKLPRFAKQQMALGSIGITCQKLGEAEVMVAAGLNDILIPYNILGAPKLARLRALADKADLIVGADSAATIKGYAAHFAESAKHLPVLVECDTGMGRCGVTTSEQAVELARLIAVQPGLQFAGIFTYPAAGKYHEALQWLRDAVMALNDAGLPPRIVSSGGTPDLYHAHEGVGLITDYRPGTYIYSDRYQAAKGVGTLEDCALSVLTTVVSRPTATRCVVDAGSKALTSDLLGMDGYGYVVGYPEAVVKSLSEEHGVIDFSACAASPSIGDRLRIIPNHACVVSNLFDKVNLVSGDDFVEAVPVSARGRVD